MQRITFEDTTITRQPYVTIDNVDYEVHDGTYQGGTDLDADTFNTLQDNIEDALSNVGGNEIAISETEPTTETTKLWINNGEIGTPASEITNSYSTSTGIGYSANYVNNNVGVVESGSNTNGSYIKFSDGTMICYSKEAKANIPINTSDGSLYKSADLSLQDFPQTFYSVPTINTFITNNNWSIICIGRPSTSTVTVSNPGSINVYKTTSTGTGVVAFYVNTIAIGRWK